MAVSHQRNFTDHHRDIPGVSHGHAVVRNTHPFRVRYGLDRTSLREVEGVWNAVRDQAERLFGYDEEVMAAEAKAYP